jgi:hypothetical protein
MAAIALDWYHPDRSLAIAALVPRPHSSRGPGHRPLKAEITGSNPVCGTTLARSRYGECVLPAQVCEAMSLRSRVGLTVRPSPTWWRSTAVVITLVVSACAPAMSASATPSRPALGLPASSAGVCQAMAALPDVSVAEHAFTNVAHDALHRLAADPRLGRTLAARVLEAMQKVEADFSRSSDAAALVGDLGELQTSADTALRAIGEEVPGCAG